MEAKDLHKRLEEAAENYPISSQVKTFISGGEWMFDEAIEIVKEWPKTSFFQCQGDDDVYWDSAYSDITEALEFFESDMKKLLEEEKRNDISRRILRNETKRLQIGGLICKKVFQMFFRIKV